MKTFCSTTIIAALMLVILIGCSSKQNDQLTQQQKDQISKEILVVCDSISVRLQRLDPRWLDYYIDSPDWSMLNADGTRWDYQTTKKVQPDFFNSVISCKWTMINQKFIYLTKEVVICSIDSKDETILKPADKIKADKILNSLYPSDESTKLGDRITYDPHAYTLIFKKVDGQWKVIYSHDSGIPVTQKAEKK
jgi:hypothetical protein